MRVPIFLCLLHVPFIVSEGNLQRRSPHDLLSPNINDRAAIHVRKITLISILSPRQDSEGGDSSEGSSTDEGSSDSDSSGEDSGSDSGTGTDSGSGSTDSNGSDTDPDNSAEESAAAESAAAESAAAFSARISSDDVVISTDGIHETLGGDPYNIAAATTATDGYNDYGTTATMGGVGASSTTNNFRMASSSNGAASTSTATIGGGGSPSTGSDSGSGTGVVGVKLGMLSVSAIGVLMLIVWL